jgi:hypothetical protein
MIKFFRHIRQSLIVKNQTGKYFKYAIGEIVLVVFGILIALQINNWNESRKEASFELQILKAFKESLEADLSDIDGNIGLHQRGLKAADSILGLMKSPASIDEDSLAILFMRVMIHTRFVHSTSAFESLKAKGVNIISNDNLQKKIVDVYDSQYNFFLLNEQDFVDQMMIGWHTVFPSRFEEGVDVDIISGKFEGSLMPIDFESLKKDQEFLYYLKTVRNWTMIFIEFHYRKLRTAIVELLVLINKEIDREETS